MPSDFGINNDGGGFAFDDDSDLDQLLRIAAQGEADEESGDFGIFSDGEAEISAAPIDRGVRQSTSADETLLEAPSEQSPYPQHEEHQYGSNKHVVPPTENEHHQETTVSAPSPETASVKPIQSSYQEPIDTYQEPITNFNNEPENSFTPHRPIIRKEAEMIEETKKIIRVLDVYREFSDDVKNIVAQFVYNDNDVDITNEAQLVVKVLNADEMLAKTMTNLKETASQKDRVERVFYILRLEQNELKTLGSLVSTLTENNISSASDNIGFARELEAAIEKLDPKIIQYVVATESVLKAAH